MENNAKNHDRPSRSKKAGDVIPGPGPIAESYSPGKRPGGQAARSTYEAVSHPQESGLGYDAATPEKMPPAKGIKKASGPTPAPRLRKPCPPGQNTASDYFSPQPGYTVRRRRKPTG